MRNSLCCRSHTDKPLAFPNRRGSLTHLEGLQWRATASSTSAEMVLASGRALHHVLHAIASDPIEIVEMKPGGHY